MEAAVSWTLATLALAVLAVAAVSRRARRARPSRRRSLFVAIGVLAGPRVLGEFDVVAGEPSVRTLAEATLTVVLFADASRIDLRALRRDHGLPVRLLGIGLPLTIVAGRARRGAAARRAHARSRRSCSPCCSRPTDAALGQAVVTEPRLPLRIRQGLNVESGLNDGICVPLLLIALAAAERRRARRDEPPRGRRRARGDRLRRRRRRVAGVVAAAVVVVGRAPRADRRRLAAGRPGRRRRARLRHRRAARRLRASSPPSSAGMCFGAPARAATPAASPAFNEELGGLLNGVTFVAFGAILLGPALGELTWQLALYAVLSLTVVRMVPVALALLGSGARRQTVGFVGLVRAARARLDRLRGPRAGGRRRSRTRTRSCSPPTRPSASRCSPTASPRRRSRAATRPVRGAPARPPSGDGEPSRRRPAAAQARRAVRVTRHPSHRSTAPAADALRSAGPVGHGRAPPRVCATQNTAPAGSATGPMRPYGVSNGGAST